MGGLGKKDSLPSIVKAKRREMTPNMRQKVSRKVN